MRGGSSPSIANCGCPSTPHDSRGWACSPRSLSIGGRSTQDKGTMASISARPCLDVIRMDEMEVVDHWREIIRNARRGQKGVQTNPKPSATLLSCAVRRPPKARGVSHQTQEDAILKIGIHPHSWRRTRESASRDWRFQMHVVLT